MNKNETIKLCSIIIIYYIMSIWNNNIFLIFFSRLFNATKMKLEIYELKNYFQLCKEGLLINKKHFKKVENPKVSIIVAVYNREKYLLRFLRSIQNQNFHEIEIILVDDFSNDNSTEVIEKLKNEDERIILLKNKRNKGTLISRNIAGLKARGEYLIFPDPDDIMSQTVLENCYHVAKKFNYEFIRFHMYSDKYYIFSLIPENLPDIITQPDLRVHLVYGFGFASITDGILNNKFVTKVLFIKSLNSINEYYLKQKMIYFEDGLINFSFYLNAKSLFLLRSIGYYYFLNSDSISQSLRIDSYFRCFFLYLKYVYENTKNTLIEKNMTFYFLQNYIRKNEVLYKISNYSEIYKDVLKQIAKCEFKSPFFISKIKDLKVVFENLKILTHKKVY